MRKFKPMILEIETEILNLYAVNKSEIEISNELEIPSYIVNSVITNFMQDNSKDGELDIVDLFVNKRMNVIEISKQTGMDTRTVLETLKQHSSSSVKPKKSSNQTTSSHSQLQVTIPVPKVFEESIPVSKLESVTPLNATTTTQKKLPKRLMEIGEDTVRKIISAYKNDCELHLICSNHDINTSHLYALLDYHNIPRKRYKTSGVHLIKPEDNRLDITEKELIVLLINQVDKHSIVEKFNVTLEQVNNTALKHHIKSEFISNSKDLDIAILHRNKKTTKDIADSYAIQSNVVRFILNYHKLGVN